MEEVYVLMEAVLHFRPCNRTEWVIAVCKDEESVIEVINEKLKGMEKDFGKWSYNGPIAEGDICNFKEVSKSDIFKWLTKEDWITDEYTFLTRFYKDTTRHRRDVWSFYVQKMPIR